MDQRAPSAAVEAAKQRYIALRQIGNELNTALQAIESDTRLARVGKDQEQSVLRSKAKEQATPIVAKALEMIEAAEQGKTGWSLDAFLMQQEFQRPTTQMDLLERVHFGLVTPRASLGELRNLMVDATERKDFWRVSMVKRECGHRIGQGLSEGEKGHAAETIGIAATAEPLDFKTERAALVELERMKLFIEKAYRDLDGWGLSGLAAA